MRKVLKARGKYFFRKTAKKAHVTCEQRMPMRLPQGCIDELVQQRDLDEGAVPRSRQHHRPHRRAAWCADSGMPGKTLWRKWKLFFDSLSSDQYLMGAQPIMAYILCNRPISRNLKKFTSKWVRCSEQILRGKYIFLLYITYTY